MRTAVARAAEVCPVELAVAILGGSWKLTTVKILLEGTHRSSELARRMPQAPARTLTRQLRELEEDGIISRQVYPEVPPRVEYSLTSLGVSLQKLVETMNAWGEGYEAGLREQWRCS